MPYLGPGWSVQTCQGSRPPLGGPASLGFGGPPMARRPATWSVTSPLSPSRRDGVASGPGTRAHVVTRVRAARHEQPWSVAARGARSRTPGARASGSRGTRGTVVAPPLGQCPGVPGSVPRRSRVGTASPVGEVAEALLPASPRPSGLAIGDRVRPRRPNLGHPSLGSDAAHPMFSSAETSRSRSGLRAGHFRPSAFHSGLRSSGRREGALDLSTGLGQRGVPSAWEVPRWSFLQGDSDPSRRLYPVKHLLARLRRH